MNKMGLYMEMDDLIQEINKIYEDVRKEKCEKCRFRAFSKKMDGLNLSNEILKEIKLELGEEKEYKKHKWTQFLIPVAKNFILPLLISIVVACLSHTIDKEDYRKLVYSIILIFYSSYLFLSLSYCIVICFDINRDKHNCMIRFLDKYIREQELKKLTN